MQTTKTIDPVTFLAGKNFVCELREAVVSTMNNTFEPATAASF
jgi:hypothetical protein